MKLSMTKPGKEAVFWYGMTPPNDSTAFQHKNAKSLSLSVLTITPECESLTYSVMYLQSRANEGCITILNSNIC